MVKTKTNGLKNLGPDYVPTAWLCLLAIDKEHGLAPAFLYYCHQHTHESIIMDIHKVLGNVNDDIGRSFNTEKQIDEDESSL